MEQFLLNNTWIFILAALWILPWKGLSLWKSARSGHKGWFIAILMLNTLAILDIVYIFLFSERSKGGKEKNAALEQR